METSREHIWAWWSPEPLSDKGNDSSPTPQGQSRVEHDSVLSLALVEEGTEVTPGLLRFLPLWREHHITEGAAHTSIRVNCVRILLCVIKSEGKGTSGSDIGIHKYPFPQVWQP